MNATITNPTPKARFMESADNVSKHREMVDSREFQRACDYALMQAAARLASNMDENNPNSILAWGLKFKGAVEFMSELRMLSEAPPVPKPVAKSDNLIHGLS